MMDLEKMETKDVMISIESSTEASKYSLRSPGHTCLGLAYWGSRVGSPFTKSASKSLRTEES